jgi:hypothetical protein
MTTVDELYTLERGFWEQGGQFYETNLADDVLMAFPDMAGSQKREEVAATATDDTRWTDVEMHHKGLVMPIAEVALITYEATATRHDGTPYAALVSSGYVWVEGDWKMMFHAQTPKVEADAA